MEGGGEGEGGGGRFAAGIKIAAENHPIVRGRKILKKKME